ncbi:hypothetical protein C4559_04125 [Candidatus Microgenomates bacterium]|nr:MAG: hypothetical protein C4559_04125 [Candidatus Microgenomates bacterium]
MQSFIVSSRDSKKTQDYALKICLDEKISNFDITIVEPIITKSIGIEEIRNIQKRIFLTPVKSKTKAFIIKNSESLTIEAQNAFLKILEEPPQNTFIILTVTDKNILLPTIISRCKVIEIKEELVSLSKEEALENMDYLTNLLKAGAGERLKLAQDMGKTKEEAIENLKKMIIALRELMLNNYSNSIKTTLNSDSIGVNSKDILIALNKTYTILSTTNANPRLTLENLFLNL